MLSVTRCNFFEVYIREIFPEGVIIFFRPACSKQGPLLHADSEIDRLYGYGDFCMCFGAAIKISGYFSLRLLAVPDMFSACGQYTRPPRRCKGEKEGKTRAAHPAACFMHYTPYLPRDAGGQMRKWTQPLSIPARLPPLSPPATKGDARIGALARIPCFSLVPIRWERIHDSKIQADSVIQEFVRALVFARGFDHLVIATIWQRMLLENAIRYVASWEKTSPPIRYRTLFRPPPSFMLDSPDTSERVSFISDRLTSRCLHRFVECTRSAFFRDPLCAYIRLHQNGERTVPHWPISTSMTNKTSYEHSLLLLIRIFYQDSLRDSCKNPIAIIYY